MTNNPVSQFEDSLCRATRRKGNDEQIAEVTSHYQDLYHEAIAKGATVEEARKHADEHIGDVTEIAKAILTGNPKALGVKLQWIAMVLLVLGAMIPRLLDMNGYEIGSVRGRIIEASTPIGLITIYVAGFLAVLGVMRAKRIALLAFCLAIILIPAGHTAILLRFSRSISTYDARTKSYNENLQQYAIKYRPIMKERYDLYFTSISGSQKESADAIRKLSASVKRPQDRGVVILDGEKGTLIYPLSIQKVRERNIKVFPLRDDNLNWIHFGATNSIADAQREWRSADELLKAIPILRKGSEAEFATSSQVRANPASTAIMQLTLLNMIPFFYSLVLSFLLFGIVAKLKQLIAGIRRAL